MTTSARRRETRGALLLPRPTASYPPLVGGTLALEFVNSITQHETSGGIDYLFPGYGNLLGWCRYARLLDEAPALELYRLGKQDAREAAQVRRRAAALRDAIYQVLTQPEAASDALSVLDAEYHAALKHRRLALSDERLAWVWPDAPALDRPLWLVAVDAVELLMGERRAQVRQCASPTCGRFFLDTTRNHSRQFCRANTCGTRERVHRFRQNRPA